MYLELESVFNTPGFAQPFRYALEGFEGLLPLAGPPEIEGKARNRTGIVTLEGTAAIRMHAACDRCAAPFEYSAGVPFAHTLVLSRNSDESDELILLDSFRWSPDSLVWEDIVLSLPPRLLCGPACKGLCPRCGQNLNEGTCACESEGDPRWAALQSLKSDI